MFFYLNDKYKDTKVLMHKTFQDLKFPAAPGVQPIYPPPGYATSQQPGQHTLSRYSFSYSYKPCQEKLKEKQIGSVVSEILQYKQTN